MDVEMAPPAPVASTSAAPAPASAPSVPPGRRAKLTEEALLAASRKVIKVLTTQSMRQSFSEIAAVFEDPSVYGPEEGKQQFEVLMEGLKEIVVGHYGKGIPLAWADMCERYSFIERANELDLVVEKAKQAKKEGAAPRNLYQLGADGQITIPNSTIPVLRTAASELREKRLALAEQNTATYDRISKSQATVTRMEGQLKDILDDFAKAMDILKSVDDQAIAELQDQLLEAVPVDGA
ncbi:hypothetical protein BCR35DRAFT_311333 [Leucosporidium creatinivorum]|uniref:Nnf1-domain-containing protein n=1 Tax=Leucosporidium creatinivorum TaxID=106004 RepID=A0A1Y2C482_9BASI|nr:hypothetical protein BCR35DRAFT_311333 [Leucosporidium creatinivorum]